MQVVLIAGVAENGVIGRGGTMPWRLKSDMQHFRALTAGKPVVMGRKTYLSLSIKPLPRRTSIVVTRDPAFPAPGVTRTFCGKCGTPLTYQRDAERGTIDVTTVTLDAANDFAPTKEIWVEHKLVWESLNDALPHYARSSVGVSPQRD